MPSSIAVLITQNLTLTRKIQSIIQSLRKLRLEVCENLVEASEYLADEDLALVLVHLPNGSNDAEVCRFLQTKATCQKSFATLVLSDEYRNHQAVAMLRAGAADYFGLPQDTTKMAYLIDVLTMRARGVENDSAAPVEKKSNAPKSVQTSYVLDPEMVEIMDQVRRVTGQETTLLLTGETGTGKTRLARLIHELSPRRDEPFLVVDCAALSANLIESEMFGHVKGAFTGAEQNRSGKFSAVGCGTLLLDDINALPLSLQSKLLRAVDERVYEPVGSNQLQPLQARLIVASNTSLEDEVQAGRFRADLYYRLNVVGFYLPPLRERTPAIGPLANKFLAEYATRSGRDIKSITAEALQFLIDYDWPGNIRELRNVIERAVLLTAGSEICPRDLPHSLQNGKSTTVGRTLSSGLQAASGPHMSMKLSKEEAETLEITEALMKHGNNRLRAAAELGISRMALYKKMHKYGMMDTSSRKANGKKTSKPQSNSESAAG